MKYSTLNHIFYRQKKGFLQSLLLIAIFQITLLSNLSAQQRTSHRWQIGVSGGLMGYWGDLNENFIQPSQGWLDKDTDLLTYSAFIERLGKSGLGWRFYAARGAFEATDRRIDWDGNLEATYPYFDRGLNVRTKIQEAGWQLVFRTDNDWLLGSRAFVSPYLAIGGGITRFMPYGDRYYGESNSPYYYWADGTIRDLAENPLNQATAQIISPDQDYETELWYYDTEGEDYNGLTWHASATFGLNFRLGRRLGLQIEYNARYTGTDYLDDISGNYLSGGSDKSMYLSNPTGWQGSRSTTDKKWFDAYHFATIGLRYRLGKQTSELDLPIIYHDEYAYPEKVEANAEEVQAALEENGKDSVATTQSNDPRMPRLIHPYFSSTVGLLAFDAQKKPIPWEVNFPLPMREPVLAKKDKPFQVLPDTTSQVSGTTKPAPNETSTAKTETAKPKEVAKKFSPVPEKEATEEKPTAVANTNEAKTGTDSVSVAKVEKVSVEEIAPKNNEKPKKGGFSVVPTEEKEEKPEKKKVDKNRMVVSPATPVAPANTKVVDSLKEVSRQQQYQIDQLRAQLYAVQRALPNYTPIIVGGVGQGNYTGQPVANPNDSVSTATAQRMNDLMRRVEALEYQLMALRSNGTGNVPPNTSGADAMVLQQLQQMNQQLQQLVQQTLNSQQQQLAQQQRMQETIQRLEGKVATAGSTPTVTPPVVVQTPPTTAGLADTFAKTVVFFELGSAKLSTWSTSRLQAVGLFLSQNPSQRMLIRGYTDQTGSANTNAKLAQQRAQKVTTFLQQMGVNPSQFTLDYTGPDLTLTEKNSSYGRRVEIIKQ